MRRITNIIVGLLAIITYTQLTVNYSWGPPGPPPDTPVGGDIANALTIAAVAVYGWWRMRRK